MTCHPAIVHAQPSAAGPIVPQEGEIYRRQAMLKQGDLEHGRQLFQDEQRLACSRCHAIQEGDSAKAGPNLFAVGDKFGRREIIDAILHPSTTIAVGYSTTTVETRSGEETTGILKRVTDDALELMNAEGQLIRIPKREILEQQTSDVSLMPEGLAAGLTPAEFGDLVEYLASLKQPSNAATAHLGMPWEISALPHSITLSPFITEAFAFAHPVWMGPMPGASNVFLVVEHESGTIWRLEKRQDGSDIKSVFAQLSGVQKGTRGLLGMVLHPNFAENRIYYAAQHRVTNGAFATYVFERQAAPDGRTDSGRAERVLLKLEATSNVHYGGSLEFGPDGFLYVGMGDSGPQEDPRGNGQNLGVLLGKIMRIDVTHPSAEKLYAIPPGNPWPHRPGVRPEIWAYGFREPWRFSFDPATGDLWVGDVGQDRYEEVDIVRPGENYGWNVNEGFERFSNEFLRPDTITVPPVFAYPRKFGPSVTGGYVYRAQPGCSFDGVYVFGDYESKRIFGLTQTNRALQKVRQLAVAPQRIVSFGRGSDGELFLVGYEGMIYKLDFNETRFE